MANDRRRVERMRNVPLGNSDREPRRRGPSVRTRFVARAESLKTDPAFHRNVCRLRRAWNRVDPKYALAEPRWMPETGFGKDYRLFLLPPALASEYNVVVESGGQD